MARRALIKMNGEELLGSIEDYVRHCAESERIPNRAGYLRFMHLTRDDYFRLCRKYEKEAQLADSIFEDEALNANTKRISSSVLNLYMKERFGYGSGEQEREGEDGGVRVICSHEDYE